MDIQFFLGRGEGSLPVIFVIIELPSIECDTNKSKTWSHIVVYANFSAQPPKKIHEKAQFAVCTKT